MGTKRQSPPGIQPRASFSTAGGSPKPLAPHPSRPFWKWFILIVVCALALRAANALFILQPEDPQFAPDIFPDSDMWTNHNQALEMVANHGFPNDYLRHAPLYVCLIAAVYLIFPGQFALIYAIQVAAGSLLCGLLYWMGRRLWGETEGRIAGLAAACYAPLMFYETTFLSDSLAIALVAVLVALALVYQDAQRRPLLLACAMGSALGLTTLQRSSLTFMGVALAPWMLIVPRQFPLRTRFLSLLYAAALALFVSVVLFFVAGRYRAASVPLYLLFAARAVTWLVQEAKRVHASRPAKMFIPSVLFVLFVLFVLCVLCNSLDTSRFHSMWYCDSMPHNKMANQFALALEAGDLAAAERAAARLFWIRDADYQRDGHLALAEVARR